MNISSTRREGILVLSLDGRLDALGAIDLENSLNALLPATERTAVLDMGGVAYLSSAGIRTVLASEKKLRARKGSLHLARVQPYPLSVLEMTGFVTILSLHPTCEEAVRAAKSTIEPVTEKNEYRLHIGETDYTVTWTGSGTSALEITGCPWQREGDYRRDGGIFPVTVPPDSCSMGWGIPGRMDDPVSRLMGDLLTIGNVAVWLSPECDDTLDYLILDQKRSGIPITAKFLVSSSGTARHVVRMNSNSGEGIMLSHLFDALFSIVRQLETRYQGILHISFCAESPEVHILCLSPDDRDSSGPSPELITNPGSYVTLAGCAIAVDSATQPAHFRGAVADALVHRIPGHPGGVPRVMGLIFRDLPVDEAKSLCETVENGLSSGSRALLRHLSTRTMIRSAILQISIISDILLNTGTDIIIEGDIPGWNNDYEKIVKFLHPDCSEVRLFPISGGFSGSLVFRDEAYDRQGRKEMAFVLKLDSWNNISAEVKGYEGHVKRYIQNNATQIIQTERSGDYGGILYTFVGIHGSQSKIFSLQEYYQTHSPGEVLQVFDILFRTVLRAWYGQPRLRDLPLYQVYSDIYNYEAVKKWAQSRYGISPKSEFIELPYGLGMSDNPLYFMEFVLPGRLSSNWSAYEGSVHGDLNMKNVLMDEEKNLWLIDFAMTGHSHILRDIAKLESVLKMEMIPIVSVERLHLLLEIEKVFLSPKKMGEIPHLPPGITDPDIVKAFAVVTQLRRFADTITLLDEDIRQYYLALLFYTLCIPSYPSVNEHMREYAWISSSLLCRALR